MTNNQVKANNQINSIEYMRQTALKLMKRLIVLKANETPRSLKWREYDANLNKVDKTLSRLNEMERETVAMLAINIAMDTHNDG